MAKSLLLFGVFCSTLIQALTTPVFSANTPRIIPMEDFFRNPQEIGHDLSPSGNNIAFLKPWKNRLNIFIYNNNNFENAERITESTERDIISYFWKTDDMIIYFQDKGGDENYQPYSINLKTKEIKHLVDLPETKVRLVDDLLYTDSEHILISHNARDKKIFDVYKLNVKTGKTTLIIKNPGNYLGYLTDHKGIIRIALESDGVNETILYRATENDPFTPLVTTNFKDSFNPLFFTFDNENLFVSSNIGRDKSAIFLYDLDKKAESKLIFEHPEVDVSHLMASEYRQRITGIKYYTDKSHYHFLDQHRQEIQERLEVHLPNTEVRVVSFSTDETKALVATFSDRDMGAYYFYDVERNQLKKIEDVAPWINPDELAHMQPIQYQSRDGLTIHGYLTLPVGVPAKNLPVIIHPHGGPSARDYWGFASDVQFLANRGYAVLQPNFRGSTGYGKKFWQAGFKQWGRDMQNDLTDGVEWLIKQGIADPKRVGIFGASYGGYATLAGLVFTPHLYACGVDYVGVSNLFTLFESLPAYWELLNEKQYEMIGNPKTEKELLRSISPVFHVDKMVAPLLVAQGANDPRVSKAESDQIVNALRKRNIDVQYILKEDEGHGFRNEENQFDFYRAMEKFLAKHLGGRIEPRTPNKLSKVEEPSSLDSTCIAE